jgi:hypothetical protein
MKIYLLVILIGTIAAASRRNAESAPPEVSA